MKFKIRDILNEAHPGLANPSKLISDTVAVPITYILLRFTKATPNSVTIASLILGLASAGFNFAMVPYLPIILFYFAYVLDFVDGMLARMLNISSEEGKRLDIRVDRTIFIAIALSYTHLFLSSNRLVETFLLIIYALLFFYVDIIEFSSAVFRHRTGKVASQEGASAKEGRDDLIWFKSLFNIRLWIPGRDFTVPLVFVIAPLIGNFKPCYILAIAILLTVLILPFFRNYICKVKNLAGIINLC